jgi:hypothetical protein
MGNWQEAEGHSLVTEHREKREKFYWLHDYLTICRIKRRNLSSSNLEKSGRNREAKIISFLQFSVNSVISVAGPYLSLCFPNCGLLY